MPNFQTADVERCWPIDVPFDAELAVRIAAEANERELKNHSLSVFVRISVPVLAEPPKEEKDEPFHRNGEQPSFKKKELGCSGGRVIKKGNSLS